MTFDRRSILGAGLGLGAVATAARAADKSPIAANTIDISPTLTPDDGRDQTSALQAAIDAAAEKDVPLSLPPGTFHRQRSSPASPAHDSSARRGRRHSLLAAAMPSSRPTKPTDSFSTVLPSIALIRKFDAGRGEGGRLALRSKDLRLADLDIRNSIGISPFARRMQRAGSTASTISGALDAGLKSLDAAGLDITGNTISDCGNNGILIWRSEQGEDGSVVSGNRISRIRNAAGGSGEYGNGINVFRAGSVLVTGNRISDCAYTAVRGNAASNIQIIANSCERLAARLRSMRNSASRARSSRTTSSIPLRPAFR